MAMLNFKYGLHSNLPAYDETKLGTIYVTSDEHAMYIDLPKDATNNPNGRIRLSQIITIPTITEWEGMQPPYSEEAFYYVVEANALLKYNGVVDGVHDWKQINSTAAIKEELNSVAARVKAIEDEDYSTQIANINTDIDNLEKEDETLAQGIADAEAAIAAVENRATGLEKMLSFKGTVTELPASATENDTCIYGGEIYIYHTAEDGQVKWEAYADLVQQIEDLKDTVSTMATDTALTALREKVTALEQWKATAQPAIEAAQAAAEAAQGTADQAVSDAAGALAAAQGAQGTADQAVSDAADAATAAANAQTKADSAYNLADTKTTMEAVEAKNYATKGEAQDMADAVLGSDGDAATANTVFGAKAAAKAAHDAADDAATAAANAKTQADKGVEDAAAAQAKADSAYELAQTAQSNANDRVLKSEFETFKTNNTTAINEAKQAGLDGQAAAVTADGKAVAAQNRADAAYTLAEGKTTMAEVEAKNYATKSEAQEMANNVLGNTSDGSSDKTVYGAHAAAAEALAAAVAADEKVTQEISDRESAISGLRAEITNNMQTADAMVFIDVVASEDELPAVGATVNGKKLSNGWTYKAVDEFIMENGTPVYIGDLLIASGTEGEDGSLTSVTWKHVPSGYVADYNPKMDLVNAGDNLAKITLTSGANKTDSDDTNDYDGDLGNVIIKSAADSAVTVAVTGSEIAIGMAWGTF